jgi:hypothetical protein
MALRWKIYAVFFTAIVFANALFNLLPSSPIYNYYRIMIILDKSHFSDLMLCYFANFMEALSLIPLFLFAFKKIWGHQNLWRLIFIARIIGLLLGRNYEYNTIAALFAESFWLTITSVTVTVLIALPSYVAQFLYAFRKIK